jgi:hypothetical protein
MVVLIAGGEGGAVERVSHQVAQGVLEAAGRYLLSDVHRQPL